MIHYKDVEIGSLYKTESKINTADYSQIISSDSCFLIISKDRMNIGKIKRYRIGIIYNDLKQVLLFSNSKLPLEKVI